MILSKLANIRIRSLLLPFALLSVLAIGGSLARANGVPSVLDSFDDPKTSSLGHERILMSDTTAGGKSQAKQSVTDGVLTISGTIEPPRGQPGWVSLVLLLNQDGAPADLSQYEGVRLRVKVKQGFLSVSANSSKIENFDYHSAMVPPKSRADFQEVRLPFKEMKRAWSEQTPLDPATIASISIVTVNMQKASFAYELDEIGFY